MGRRRESEKEGFFFKKEKVKGSARWMDFINYLCHLYYMFYIVLPFTAKIQVDHYETMFSLETDSILGLYHKEAILPYFKKQISSHLKSYSK